MSAEIQSVRIFIAYSSKDLEFQRELKNHLEPLVRNKRIVVMDNYAINPGDNWDEKIGQMLEQSDIVLLLLSADALASPHFFREAGIAIERRRQGRTDIIPVKLRPCDLEDESLLQELDLLEVLPEKDVPVVKWQHRDEAYLSIVQGLKRVLRVREEATLALGQRIQRQKEYADLSDQAETLMKKKKWAEAKSLLDKALKTWEEGFEPSRESLEKQLDKCKEEIRAIEGAERKKLDQQEAERKKREQEEAKKKRREEVEKRQREEAERKRREDEEAPPAAPKRKRNYYEVLGVPTIAASDVIEKAYAEKKRTVSPGSEADLELQEAYRILSDADLRRKYDRYGHAMVPSTNEMNEMSMDDILRRLGFDIDQTAE